MPSTRKAAQIMRAPLGLAKAVGTLGRVYAMATAEAWTSWRRLRRVPELDGNTRKTLIAYNVTHRLNLEHARLNSVSDELLDSFPARHTAQAHYTGTRFSPQGYAKPSELENYCCAVRNEADVINHIIAGRKRISTMADDLFGPDRH